MSFPKMKVSLNFTTAHSIPFSTLKFESFLFVIKNCGTSDSLLTLVSAFVKWNSNPCSVSLVALLYALREILKVLCELNGIKHM